jgi:hypothetical protein
MERSRFFPVMAHDRRHGRHPTRPLTGGKTCQPQAPSSIPIRAAPLDDRGRAGATVPRRGPGARPRPSTIEAGLALRFLAAVLAHGRAPRRAVPPLRRETDAGGAIGREALNSAVSLRQGRRRWGRSVARPSTCRAAAAGLMPVPRSAARPSMPAWWRAAPDQAGQARSVPPRSARRSMPATCPSTCRARCDGSDAGGAIGREALGGERRRIKPGEPGDVGTAASAASIKAGEPARRSTPSGPSMPATCCAPSTCPAASLSLAGADRWGVSGSGIKHYRSLRSRWITGPQGGRPWRVLSSQPAASSLRAYR